MYVPPFRGNNYGIIYRTERDMFEVLDLQGKSVRVKPHLVSTKISSMGSTSAYDLNGQPIRKGESVVEAAGDVRPYLLTSRVLVC
jgi:transcription elongation factor